MNTTTRGVFASVLAASALLAACEQNEPTSTVPAATASSVAVKPPPPPVELMVSATFGGAHVKETNRERPDKDVHMVVFDAAPDRPVSLITAKGVEVKLVEMAPPPAPTLPPADKVTAKVNVKDRKLVSFSFRAELPDDLSLPGDKKDKKGPSEFVVTIASGKTDGSFEFSAKIGEQSAKVTVEPIERCTDAKPALGTSLPGFVRVPGEFAALSAELEKVFSQIDKPELLARAAMAVLGDHQLNVGAWAKVLKEPLCGRGSLSMVCQTETPCLVRIGENVLRIAKGSNYSLSEGTSAEFLPSGSDPGPEPPKPPSAPAASASEAPPAPPTVVP